MTPRIYFFCFVNTAAGHPLWSSQHPSIGTGKCTYLDTSIQSHRSQLSQWKKGWKTHLHVHLCLISLPIANSNSPVQLCVNSWSSVLQMRLKCRSTMGQRLFKFGSSVSQLSVNRASNVVQVLVKARTTVGQSCSKCRSIMRQSLVKHGPTMRQRWVN